MGPTSKRFLYGLLSVLSLMFLAFFTMTAIQGQPDITGGIFASGFAFASVDWEGGDNIGGFTSEAFLAIHGEVDTWPTLSANPVTDADHVTLIGDYAFKTEKSFYRIYVTPKTFGGTAEVQGEIDGKSFLQKGTFFYPSTREEALALARKLNNTRGVIIGIDPNTGKRIQFGSKDLPCTFSPKIDYGTEPSARRGLTVEFEADSLHPALIYPGAIALSESTLPAQS
jgi:hypothetical protein